MAQNLFGTTVADIQQKARLQELKRRQLLAQQAGKRSNSPTLAGGLSMFASGLAGHMFPSSSGSTEQARAEEKKTQELMTSIAGIDTLDSNGVRGLAKQFMSTGTTQGMTYGVQLMKMADARASKEATLAAKSLVSSVKPYFDKETGEYGGELTIDKQGNADLGGGAVLPVQSLRTLGLTLQKPNKPETPQIYFHSRKLPNGDIVSSGTQEALTTDQYTKRIKELGKQGVFLTKTAKESRDPRMSDASARLLKKPMDELSTKAFEKRVALDGLKTQFALRRDLESGMYSGAMAKTKVGIARVMKLMGVSSDRQEELLATSQTYEALAGKAVGEIIKLFGSGTGLSNADREYAQKIAAGDPSLDETTLKRLLYLHAKTTFASAREHNRIAEGMIDGHETLKPWESVWKVNVGEEQLKTFETVFADEIKWSKDREAAFEKGKEAANAPPISPEAPKSVFKFNIEKSKMEKWNPVTKQYEPMGG